MSTFACIATYERLDQSFHITDHFWPQCIKLRKMVLQILLENAEYFKASSFKNMTLWLLNSFLGDCLFLDRWHFQRHPFFLSRLDVRVQSSHLTILSWQKGKNWMWIKISSCHQVYCNFVWCPGCLSFLFLSNLGKDGLGVLFVNRFGNDPYSLPQVFCSWSNSLFWVDQSFACDPPVLSSSRLTVDDLAVDSHRAV